MRMVLALLLLGSVVDDPAAARPTAAIHWEPWSPSLFERATREKRLILLDLEAVWCHWCHVMDATTYTNPEVARQIARHYLAVKVDQDAQPDLAVRYQDYGWPGTILLDGDGVELVKRRGYQEPAVMAALLRATARHPVPERETPTHETPTPVDGATIDPVRRQALERAYFAAFDEQHAGWGAVHQMVSAEPLEYALEMAHGGDTRFAPLARRTLDAGLRLFDPVWGGVYQYSATLDWSSPHFEKIVSVQSDALRVYALAGALFKEPRWEDAARSVDRYLAAFFTHPEDAFYTSQDADLDARTDGRGYYALGDAGRRKLGIPRIDTHVYARENGWLIQGLLALHDATGEAAPLERARRAAQWILAHRSLPGPGGGFRHGDPDPIAGPSLRPYLGDTLQMGIAFLALYRSTGDPAWLLRAEEAARFVDTTFQVPGAGYATTPPEAGAPGVFRQPARDPDENVALARFANQLHHTTGRPEYRRMADHAVRLAARAGTRFRFFPGLLLADRELTRAPTHITVVGAKDDPRAAALHAAALRYPRSYKRVDWWDRKEGPLPRPDVTYPELPRPAAFACSGTACSLPIYDPDRLAPTVDRLGDN